ncbi:ABC transporter permease [Pendulispora albinea]|uniref:ABC-2 family transporter protein n=1 Tax=Pendulispora albinea TaxID=2741071 RepID=A0ABZ2MBH3_9BACT
MTAARDLQRRARATLRALPTMARIAFAEALAYRAEVVVWTLATTMPLVMLALWLAVAEEAPVGRWGQRELITYFLCAFMVRQLTGSWSCWQINAEVRDGTLAMRLLRPVHPMVAYAIEQLVAAPVRGMLAIPVAAVALAWVDAPPLARDPVVWLLWAISMLGAWLISLLANFAIGCTALFVESSVKIMDIWLALFFVLSGYTIPVELFPRAVRAIGDWLPFRYQLGLPIELMTGIHDRAAALSLLGRQWLMVALLAAVVTIVWRRGIGRFAAYGG